MFNQLGCLSIPDRLKYNKVVLTYRAINNLSPEYITQLLKPVSEVHTLNLRSSENGSLYMPKARTALFDGSFSCSAPRLWNALPQTVKTSGSLSTFKRSLLKQHFNPYKMSLTMILNDIPCVKLSLKPLL